MRDEIGRTVEGNKAVTLPDESGTQGFAIIGTRGGGKSATAGVFEELMCRRGIPWVALDPASAHWGINYLDDNGKPGKASGLDVLVVGGKYGQVPLDEHAGGALAEILVETDINCIVDLKVAHYGARKRFIADFANRLFELNETPRHVFLEEAHEFVPQQLRYDEQKMVFAALERLIKGGRGQGLGFSLISQRPQEVAKAVLELIDNLLLMRTRGPRSIAAAKEWIETNLADREQIADILGTLPRLPDGEAWLVSPFWLEEVTRFRVRRRETYHAGRTPKAGEKPVNPKRVELGKVIEQFRDAATKRQLAVEEQKGLKTQLREANEELGRLKSAKPVPVADPDAIARAVATATEAIRIDYERRQQTIAVLVGAAVTASAALRPATEDIIAAVRGLTEGLRTDILPALPPAKAPAAATRAAPGPAKPLPPPTYRPAPLAAAPSENGDVKLKKGERTILTMLAQAYPGSKSRAQLGLAARIRMRGSTMSVYLSTLRTAGLIEVVATDGRIVATQAGRDYLGVVPEAPTTHDAIMEMWGRKLKRGERKILEAVVAVYPDGLPRESLGEELGISMIGSTLSVYLSTLRRNELIREQGKMIYAAEELWP